MKPYMYNLKLKNGTCKWYAKGGSLEEACVNANITPDDVEEIIDTYNLLEPGEMVSVEYGLTEMY